MAKRPVFVAIDRPPFVLVQNVDFQFFPGFAVSQKQKSIMSLHECFTQTHSDYAGLVLEISSKSPVLLGVKLSAFNLQYQLNDGQFRPVECVFQSSKCFSNGCQYTDILEMTPHDAKHDNRLRNSGDVIAFRLEGEEFPTKPVTFFYDWIYINALGHNPSLVKDILNYNAFTDIEFNPDRSWNCQARSVAMFVGLSKAGVLSEALKTKDSFLSLAYQFNTQQPQIPNEARQLTMDDLLG